MLPVFCAPAVSARKRKGRIHCCCAGCIAVSARLLDLVKRKIGPGENVEVTRLTASFLACYADADGHGELLTVEYKRCVVDCGNNFARDPGRFPLVHLGKQNRKFVAPRRASTPRRSSMSAATSAKCASA